LVKTVNHLNNSFFHLSASKQGYASTTYRVGSLDRNWPNPRFHSAESHSRKSLLTS